MPGTDDVGADARTHATQPGGRRLVGVGVGPGDPELVTCKAVRLLREADAVFVPATERSGDGPGRAELTVLAHLDSDATIRRSEFSMAEAGRAVAGPRQENWEAAAAAVVEAFEGGADTVAFATIGDPSVYSTFSYLADRVLHSCPDVQVEVVPGITAMQALAAASRTPLVEGTETLMLVPATAGPAALADALDHADTVVAYKGGRQLPRMVGELRDRGRLDDAVLGEAVGLPTQSIGRLAALPEGRTAGYLSTVLVPAHRSSTGGRL